MEPSLAAWEFLSPWCQELRGRLQVSSSGRVHVHYPSWREEEREEEQALDFEDQRERERQRQWRVREAWELLVLVAQLDIELWKTLLCKKCGVHGDVPAMFTPEEEGDTAFEHDGGAVADGYSAAEEEDFKRKCRHDRDELVLPQLYFAGRMDSAMDNSNVSVLDSWGWFFLTKDLSLYQPSAEYLQTKSRILAMQSRIRRPIPTVVSVPVAIHLHLYGYRPGQFGKYLKELRELISVLKDRTQDPKPLGQELCAASAESMAHSDSAKIFTYDWDAVNLWLEEFEMTEEVARELTAILKTGIHISWLALRLTDQTLNLIIPVAAKLSQRS